MNHRQRTGSRWTDEGQRTSVESFRWFFDESREAFLLVDGATGQLLEVNRAATQLFGRTADHISSMRLCDLLPEGVNESVEKGTVENEPVVVSDAEGNPIAAELSAKLLHIEERPVIQAIFRKVNDGERLAEREADASLMFKLATNSSTDMIAALNEHFYFLFANSAYIEWHNLEEDEIVGRSFAEVVGDEPLDKTGPFLERCLAGESVKFEMSHSYPERGLRHLDMSFSPLRDTDGAIIGVVGIARDITQMKEAEAALEFEAGFRKTLGHVANDLIALDPADLDSGLTNALAAIGEHIKADRCFIQRYDFEKEVVNSTHEWCRPGVASYKETLRDVPMSLFRDLVDQLRSLRPIVFSDVAELAPCIARDMLEKAGVCAQVLVPLVLDGKCSGTVGFDYVGKNKRLPVQGVGLLEFASVTLASAIERQKVAKEKSILEEKFLQSQKMEAIGRLAGGVAHDFNNILTSITGYSDLLLLELSTNHPSRAKVEFIMSSATRAAELNRQLLAFSRKQIFSPKIVDLNRILENLSPMLIRLIGEDIELKIIPAPKLACVLVDPSQMEQVVLNLAVNARDAMLGGGQLLFETTEVFFDDSYVETHPSVSPGPYVQLAVSDSGTGMSADVQKMIFEPFFTTKKLGQGTGLGLATVDGIVAQSGGRIEVYSEPGHGTTFKVYFPRVEGKSVDNTFDASEYVGGEEIILVVEDDPFVRDLTKRMLEHLGYTVIDAASGQEAFDFTEKKGGKSIDLLLTDVVMPGMNGRELFERLSTLIPNLRVLFVSGYTQNIIANRGILDDGLRFLSKPYTIRDLAIHVRRALESKDES